MSYTITGKEVHEVVSNDGDSLGFFTDFSEAWEEFLRGEEVGSRLVMYDKVGGVPVGEMEMCEGCQPVILY